MVDPIYVTKVAKREPQYPSGITFTIPFFDYEDYEWFKETYKKTKFTFPTYHSEGIGLFYKLVQAVQQRDEPTIEEMLSKLENYTVKNYDEMTEVEKWAHTALQLPGDWGPVGENKKKLKEIITARASGRVLEAMCGFNSYFGESDKITEVVALDFCREALERYEYPERTRILYDLERVVNGEKMDFFEDGSFQTVGVFFGLDYLTNPIPVCKEFYRILSDGGKLLVVDGTMQGYADIKKRPFDPDVCSSTMRLAGFSTSIERLPVRVEGELGEYYLIEGKK